MTILSWRCPVHGPTADPLLLGGHVYCPDVDCTREISRDRAAETRTISVVVLRPRNRPGSVRMRVEAILRVAAQPITCAAMLVMIAGDTGRTPPRSAVASALRDLRKAGLAETDTRGTHGDPRYRGAWRWVGER